MSKLLSQPKLTPRTHKRVFGFSDWEIDVANQLLLFRRDDKPTLGSKLETVDANEDDDDHKTKTQDGATANFSLKRDDHYMFGDDDEDSYPKRLKQRYRCIEDIYKSAQPMLDGVKKPKKARLT